MQQIISDLAADASIQRMNAQMIAEKTGLDRKTVASILSGENESPKLQTLQEIARCLGGTVCYVTEDSKNAVKAADISYYRTMIADAHNQIRLKDRWIKMLFYTALGLVVIDAVTTIIAFLIAGSL